MSRAVTIAAATGAVVIICLAALSAPAIVATWAAVSPFVDTAASALASPSPSSPPGAADEESDPASSDPDVLNPEQEGAIVLTLQQKEGPGDCEASAMITTPWHTQGNEPVELRGELTDMGATEFAGGPVGYNADGLIESYTVQPGDTLIGIGERFCIDFVTVGVYNHRFGSSEIQPGDVLVLRPDPTAPWTP
ncbi:LysM peptidoglycan-binding domain-containing protein [Microbacterium terricola]|uniref:LysM domain-containing protein n=1 Tax=Microbacterium terricola TaxID=344163 RepID=A0ABM8E1X3_9MICO|nr:LysM domain-containing protein [Microbacterium terricola]UYK40342.1 LysM domain-containing protein [Microbacterium terricola]BDV31944.1 hypothetical protein Microterr_26040 [Microbacterium terricola]